MRGVLVVAALLAVAHSGCGRPAARDDTRIADARASAAALLARAVEGSTAAAASATPPADAAVATEAPASPTSVVRGTTPTVATADALPVATAPTRPTSARAAPVPTKATATAPRRPATRRTPTGAPDRRVTTAPARGTRIERAVDAAGQGFTGANLRARASTKARLLTLIPNGATVVLSARSVRGEGEAAWFRVRYGSRSGYVLGSLLGPPKVIREPARRRTRDTTVAPDGAPEREEAQVRARTSKRRSPRIRGPVHRVTYRVTGTASPVKILYDDANDDQAAVRVRALPWSKSFSVRGAFPYVYVVATSDTPQERKLACEILIDGRRVDMAAAEGEYYIAADCDSGE